MNIYYTDFEKKSQLNFTSISKLSYFISALAKSKAEPQNSNNLSVAHNTPLNACFFMRSTRTPKLNQLTPLVDVGVVYLLMVDISIGQNLVAQVELLILSSMVACNGKGFALCCVPLIAVSEPVTRYRPSLRTLAVTSKNLFSGVTAMIYQFLAVSRQHYDQSKAEQIRIIADNETQARTYLAPNYVLVKLGQLPDKAKNHSTLDVRSFNLAGGFYA
ncbi:host cell division inhibitor Icd-like protein [Gallibacterium melopsittaci]|uniref:Host cell division inhibitor Icd-like protein n=1 Tax=Gallibacterium melopsittaci TaxID=516063 RepID=A0ABV6HYP7_9PAST